MNDTHPPTPPVPPSSLDETEKHANTIREMIWHEDELINDRITWLASFQGFLFAALALGWDKDIPCRGLLLGLLAMLGGFTALSSLLALRDAQTAIRNLRNWWDQTRPAVYSGPPVWPLNKHQIRCRALKPWFSLPALLIIAWSGLLIMGVFGSASSNGGNSPPAACNCGPKH